ncbi:MAG: hypothetical protein A3G25_05380 [Betaproteobacteria bacterium RIFCSPLOWO2_12_FULL_63_13]|nr:MAG: hypothetical protein A3G25_05380 [Betaproteobacteria bacterium RIFCSPLOWO2_12_FULL_63_13]
MTFCSIKKQVGPPWRPQGRLCAPLPLAGLPAGIYSWRVAATAAAGRLIGAVNSEAMQIAR